MTVMTPMEGITAPARRATTPPPALPAPADPTHSRRHDGWSATNQRIFLEAIAEGHGVDAACARVGLSATSAYAFRRTAKGAAFALGWRAASLVAREVVAETLLVRALDGQTDTYTRADGSVVTRHRHDNRLAMSLLARLDRQVEATPDSDAKAARLVAQEFDAYLDLVARDAGPARAGLFLARRCGTLADDAGDAADLAPLYALAAADRFARTRHATAAEVPVDDLDPAARQHWSAEQWARAEAAGLVAFAPAPPPSPFPPAPVTPPASQHSQHSRWAEEEEPVWWDEDAEDWRTTFPPPDGFDGEWEGEPAAPDYERSLTEEEAARMGPPPDHLDATELARRAAARDAFFGLAPAPAPAALATVAAPAPVPAPAPTASPGITWFGPGAPSIAVVPEPSPRDDVACASSTAQDHDDMSIFGAIKKAIFGDHGPLGGQFSGKKDAAPAPAPSPAPNAGAAPAPAPAAPAPAPAPAAAPQAPVDVEAVLTGIAQKKGNPDLNWRTSIVDLMKLLDLDSSLANRKELATELGYAGATDGSAEMNIWLQKAVMRELEKNGGTVPAGLKD